MRKNTSSHLLHTRDAYKTTTKNNIKIKHKSLYKSQTGIPYINVKKKKRSTCRMFLYINIYNVSVYKRFALVNTFFNSFIWLCEDWAMWSKSLKIESYYRQ